MNYLMQIRAFDDYRLYNQKLSAGQVSLWYTLMSINNKTRWSTWFTAANATLESLSGLSRSGIVKNRNVLKQLELIDFASNGRKATSYHVCTLYTEDSIQGSVQSSVPNSVQGSVQSSVPNSSTLLKQNKTKQKDEDDGAVTRSEVIDKWTALWGFPNAIAMPELNDWLQQLSPDIIDYAIQIAGEHDVQSRGALKYLRAVIDGWQQRNITTLEQAKKAAEEHDQRMANGRRSNTKPAHAKETLPDWAQRDSGQPKAPAKKLSAEQQAELDSRIQKLRQRNKKQEA